MTPHDAENPITDDAITRDFRVFQRVRGHRLSLDDVATAWVAARRAPSALRVLDLGSGIGSVALMLAWKLPEARFTTIEAQEVSFALQKRNIERNGLASRFTTVLGDLRDPRVLDGLEVGFDLVTGTPPYFPATGALRSPDEQRAYARLELRGGVEDYLEAAARWVASTGLVVLCASARRSEQAITRAREVGLGCECELRVVPRVGKPALFSVLTLSPNASGPLACETLLARGDGGARTPEHRAIREFFGLSSSEAEAKSMSELPSSTSSILGAAT